MFVSGLPSESLTLQGCVSEDACKCGGQMMSSGSFPTASHLNFWGSHLSLIQELTNWIHWLASKLLWSLHLCLIGLGTQVHTFTLGLLCEWTQVNTSTPGLLCEWTQVHTSTPGLLCGRTQVHTSTPGFLCEWTQVHTSTPGFLCEWMLGYKLRSWCLHGKHFTDWTTSPALPPMCRNLTFFLWFSYLHLLWRKWQFNWT